MTAVTDEISVPGPLRAAVVLILVEAVALLWGAGFLVYATIVGKPSDAARALLQKLAG